MNVCFLIGCRFIKAFLTFFWLCFWLFWCFLLYIVMFCGNSSSSLFVIFPVTLVYSDRRVLTALSGSSIGTFSMYILILIVWFKFYIGIG